MFSVIRQMAQGSLLERRKYTRGSMLDWMSFHCSSFSWMISSQEVTACFALYRDCCKKQWNLGLFHIKVELAALFIIIGMTSFLCKYAMLILQPFKYQSWLFAIQKRLFNHLLQLLCKASLHHGQHYFLEGHQEECIWLQIKFSFQKCRLL